MNSIGNRIRLLRKSKGMTQECFADRLLVSQAYLSGLENGNEIPSDKLIKIICYEFGVNEPWLLSGSGEMNRNTDEDDIGRLAKLALKLFFEVSDSAMFGGVGTKGYSMVSLDVNEDILECMDKMIAYQKEMTAKILGVSADRVRLISEKEYDLMTEDGPCSGDIPVLDRF